MLKPHVLLINIATGRGSEGMRYVPLGIAYIASEIREAGHHEVRCIDYQIPSVTDEQVIDELSNADYVLVGIRGFAGDYLRVKELAARIKREVSENLAVAVGGPLATFSYEPVLQTTAVDFCVLGEGETTAVKLLENLKRPHLVPGIAFRDITGKVIRTSGGMLPEKDIDSIAWPAYDLFDVEQYIYRSPSIPGLLNVKKVRSLDIITGRGCPFSCKFCGKLVEKYRKRNVDDVIKEMRFLISRYQVEHFCINDELFYPYKKWTSEFSKKVAELGITWNFAARARGFKLADLQEMRASGCLRINMGVESGSAENLAETQKRITPDDIRESVRLLREADIYPGCSLILGFPTETAKTGWETVALIDELDLPPKTFGLLQPYPGSPYFYEYMEKGIIKSHETCL